MMNLDNLPTDEQVLEMIGLLIGTRMTLCAYVTGIEDFGRKIVLALPSKRGGVYFMMTLDSGYVEELLDERLLDEKTGGTGDGPDPAEEYW